MSSIERDSFRTKVGSWRTTANNSDGFRHAAFVFRQLPAATLAPTNNPKMALFQALPTQFNRAKYIEAATQLQIP
jgi:hypothetical protein